jgi:adenine-specific DNA glycosylase
MGDWDGASDPAAAVREAFATRARLAVEVLRPLGQVVHVFTHRRLTVQIFEVVAGSAPCPTLGDPSYEALGWWHDGAEGMGLSKLSRKLLAAHDTPELPLAAEPRFGDRGDAGGVSG